MKHAYLLLLLLLPLTNTLAQQPCLTDGTALLERLTGNDPDLLQAIVDATAELELFTQEFADQQEAVRSDYTIPVVFHIIHNNGPENISDAQVLDALRILNEDLNRENADWQTVRPEFLGIVADVGVEFKLARKDPLGNCTNGITRTQSVLTYEGEQGMKSLIQWPRNRYLNVWICASAGGPGVLGYTMRPGTAAFLPTQDGIVVVHNAIGSIGTSSNSYSRTLTHEVGHWINLAHTWGNTNEPALSTNCTDDDGVADTPNTIGWTSCNLNGNTCNSLDNVQNFMDYSFCSRMFTNGQGTRMIAALNNSTAQRNQLHTSSNLTFTGVNLPEVLCQAQFSSSTASICQGSTVTFTDQSFSGVTGREWSFPGGTPTTSTLANPTVTYANTGTYPVTLTVTDGSSSLSTTAQQAITVLPNPGAPMPFDEGFESYSDLGNSPWTVVNPDNNNSFQLHNVTAFSGVNSVRIVNTTGMAGQKDDLISAPLDMTGESSIVVSYRYAYAQRNSTNDDRLRIYVSNNCGESWTLRQQLRGTNQLNTGGTVTGSFVPTGNQWNYTAVPNISGNFLVSNFRLKFEFESDGGNNVYIDDININGSPVGLEQFLSPTNALVVVPNPAANEAQAIFASTGTGPLRLELMDVLGRSLQVLHDGTLVAGTHRVDLPVAGLHGGVYFVRMQQGQLTKVVRFVRK